ncbi:unnamed protein product [Macrosiphum euphorbiae]|uniref:Uncharacterized protein n=1 Tax=Macrosiphum euphorbiae TaxID=13131 RepID=A0AAV0WR37_9HEMI|nr:unnamed protein product [Macrosiphum euphorbiae]
MSTRLLQKQSLSAAFTKPFQMNRLDLVNADLRHSDLAGFCGISDGSGWMVFTQSYNTGDCRLLSSGREYTGESILSSGADRKLSP